MATNLELWNEAFRTIEDIHGITVAGKKTPKPHLMAIFYEKLTRIFWVAGNHLFHAFAWSRYFSLTCESRTKDLKAEEKFLLASYVLLSALSIPALKDTDQASALLLDDEHIAERNQQMATILDFQTHPSRKALISELISKGILNDVLPELASLHTLIDVKFHPLTMAQSVAPALEFIKNHPVLRMYLQPLQRVVILRVTQQLSKVYSVVKLDFIHKLLGGFFETNSSATIEKIIIDGVISRELQLTVDHVHDCIRFNNFPVAQVVDSQLAQLGKDLAQVQAVIVNTPEHKSQVQARRQTYFDKIRAEADSYHSSLLNRKNLIEQRKVEIERALEEKERAQQLVLSAEDARRQAEEDERLDQERKKREEEKKKKAQEKEDVKRVQKELERLGVYKDEATLTALDATARQALVLEAKSELQKAKEEETRKVAEHARRLDHITRALRIEATEVIKKRYEKITADDMALYEKTLAAHRDNAKAQHTTNLDEKKRLSKMQFARTAFEESLLADQLAAYQKRVQLLRDKAVREHRERKVATARRRMYEELERQREEEEMERERKDKEERARIEREQYEALRRKREEEEAIREAQEAETKRIAEEQRVELELKRQKILEEKKRAALAASAPAPVAAEAAPEKDKWRPSGPAAPTSTESGAVAKEVWRPSRVAQPSKEPDSWG